MKKWMSAIAVVALTGTMAFAAADNGGGKAWGHGHRRGIMSARLAEKLNLSDAQKDQMKALHRSFREENKAFFEQVRATHQELRAAKQAGDQAKVDSLKPTIESQRAQMKQLHQAEHDKLLSILTPEQRTQLEALKAEHKAKREQKQQQ